MTYATYKIFSHITDCFLFFQLHVCDIILEQEGVYGDVSCMELGMDLIPLDRDILSMELPSFFKSFYLVV